MLSALGKVVPSAHSMHRITSRGYHVTGAVLARKGSSAFVEKPRDFSKKQKKRFKKKMMLKGEHDKRNSTRGGAANELISQQLRSPETQELIETTGDSMLKDVREMMLPDGLQALLRQFEENEDFSLEQFGEPAAPHLSEIGLKLSSEVSPGEGAGAGLSVNLVTEAQANEAMVLAASQGKKSFVTFMFDQTSRLGIPVENSTLSSVLTHFSRLEQHEDVELFFDRALACDVTPDEGSWSAYIEARARGPGGHCSALEVLERVQRLGLTPNAGAYTAVLQDMVDEKKHDEAFEFWMRMKEDGVRAGVEGYEAMLQQCVQTYQVERAFNYLDEMRGSNVELTAGIFERLFDCCGSAPHWVNGYQDIIFDAMALMEGAELVPTPGVYNSVIRSFGRAGDAAAAEFYFWEMREKGVEQSAATYQALFEAFASAQRVGASKYSVRPRFVRPPEKPRTELQSLMMKAGAVATAEILSSRFSSEGVLERGKRQYAPLVSTEDGQDPDEAEEELLEELRQATLGQPDLGAELEKRQRGQRQLRDSETGRDTKLRLLAAGGELPGPGLVLHLPPGEGQDPSISAAEGGSTLMGAGATTDSAREEAFRSGLLAAGERSDPDDVNSIFNSNSNSLISEIFNAHSLQPRNSIVDLLDNDGAGSSSDMMSVSGDLLDHDVIPRAEVDKQWGVVLFGRCPDPDFQAPIKQRRADNITCADSLYADMLDQGIEPDCNLLSAYMSVSSEAMQWEKANKILSLFKSQHDISPDATTFRYLIRMHVFMSDIKGCLERFSEMKGRGMTPDRETYGLLVATLAHRDDLVTAVQVLEEAAGVGVTISNRHIKKLRARLNKLDVKHPNIYPDPNLWVKDVKRVRENKKKAPRGNKLQYLSSLTFL